MVVEPFEWKPSTSTDANNSTGVLNEGANAMAAFPSGTNLQALCANWLANASTNTNLGSTSVLHDSTMDSLGSHRPSHFLVWSLGLLFVTVISLCALVGILVMKLLKKSVFDKFITFFVSVGVGSLSGSAVFHLLPQAFGLVEEFDANASHAYLTRAFAAIVGIYLFFFSDKLIKIILETKKRNKFEATEMLQIDFNGKHDVEKNGTIGRKSTLNESDHSTAIDMSKPSDDSDALLFNSDKEIRKLVEEQKTVNLKDDESYNRQVHSLCVHDHDMQYKEGDSVIATVAWMIIFGDGLHNFIDGISIGASFSESILSGLSVSLAVICEEFPHELGDVAILVSAGMTLRQALVYNLLSALSCYFGFAIGVVVGNLDDTFASYTFGFAGGMFLYISMACMMPEMKHAMEEALKISLSAGLEVLFLQAAGVTCGLTIMACMARYGGEITIASM